MKQITTSLVQIAYSLLVSMALMLTTPLFGYAQEPRAKVFHLRPDDVTALVAQYGTLSSEKMTRVANPVRGFHSPQDTVTWTVIS